MSVGTTQLDQRKTQAYRLAPVHTKRSTDMSDYIYVNILNRLYIKPRFFYHTVRQRE